MPSPLMLFAGGRLGDFNLLAGTMSEDTGSWAFDPAHSDCALSLSGSGVVQGVFTDDAGAAVDVGVGHSVDVVGRIFETRFGQIVAGGILTLYDNAGHPWVRINSPTNGQIQLQVNTGTGASPAWTSLGPAPTCGLGGVMNLSVTIDAGGVHPILFALNGTTVHTGTFTNAGMTDLASFNIVNTDPGGGMYLAEVMASRDIGLVGAILKTVRGTGAGTYADWTGTVSDVNEAVTSDANYNVTTNAAQKQSYAQTDVTVPTNYSIVDVFYALRGRNDGGVSAGQNIKALCRSGSTDSISGNLSGIVGAYNYGKTRFPVDPATGVKWTQAGWNAAELGFVSAA